MVRKVAATLKYIFYPDSIAIVGASSDEQKEKTGWTGTLLNFGYKGKLYPINPKATEILGLKAYPSVKDVEGQVDYAILNVSALLVPGLLEECVDKGVKVVHIFAAGFGETGKEKGKILQKEVESIIEGTTTRVIGPNCMGVHCPESGLTFANLPKKGGAAALITQTGAGAGRIVTYASGRGIYFGKVVSYGNAVDLDSSDFLEILADDPQIQFIALYIEGIKDGHRFLNAVKECAREGKVIIMLKAGLTQASKEAAASHTGALAGSEEVWKAFFEQTGVIRVYTLEEIAEQLVALQYIPPLQGRRVGIIGRGGGPGVIATETCERAGLKVVPYSAEMRAQLEKITTADAGSMTRNPVEIGVGRAGAQQGYADAFKIVASSPEVDFILTHLNPDAFVLYGGKPEWLNYNLDALIGLFRTLPKPVAVVLPAGETPESREIVHQAWERCAEAGLAVFRSYESATRVISNLISYYQFKEAAPAP